MKLFTESDIKPSPSWDGEISADREDLEYAPLWWHKAGLTQTASGYGSKLTTAHMINFEGRMRRVYCVCWSNSGTCYFITKGRKIIVD